MLSLTAAVSFLTTAAVAHTMGRPVMTVTAAALAGTSVVYHTTKNRIAYWFDQAAILGFVGCCLWDSYRIDWIPFGWVVTTILYCNLIFHGGRQMNCWAFSPNAWENFLCHASLHVVPAFNMSLLYLAFYSPVDMRSKMDETTLQNEHHGVSPR